MSLDHNSDDMLEQEMAHAVAPSFIGQGGPASIRYNNPGAMWPGPSSRKFGAIGKQNLNDGLGQGNKIAIFTNAIDGGAALFDLLDRAYTGRTVRDAIRKWSGGNHVQSYLSVLRSKGGIQADEMITKAKLRDPEWAIRFAQAMAWHEAGRAYPLTTEHWQQAHSLAFKASKPKDILKVASSKFKAARSGVGVGGGIAAVGGVGTVAKELSSAAPAATSVSDQISTAAQIATHVKNLSDMVSGFMASHGLVVLAAVGVGIALFCLWIQDRTEKDLEEGRYTPSGEGQ